MRSHAKAATAGSKLRQARGIAAALGAVLLLALLSAPSAGAASKEKLFSFGPDGTEATDFERLGSVAVDQSDGTLYALDSTGGALYKFDPAGAPLSFSGTSSYIEGNRISGLEPFDVPQGGRAGSQVAVNSSADLFFVTEEHSLRAFHADGEPFEFTAGPGANTSEIPGFTELYGVALDAEGNIYASDRSGTISVFSPTGELLTSFSATEPYNLAVDSTGAVYVMTEQTSVAKFTPSAQPVSASTTYAEATFAKRPGVISFLLTVAVDPVTDDVFVMETNAGTAWIRRFDKSGTLLESFGEPGTPSEGEALGYASEGLAVLGVPSEIQPKTIVELYASDTNDDSKVTALGTKEVIDAPSVGDLRVTDLTATSAVLRATVDPNLKPTTYRFEYGLEDCASSPCASAPLGGAGVGEGAEPVAVSQLIAGLAIGTTYHYRIVAENELGQREEAGTFSTQPLGAAFELGDERVWEMVSPPNKQAGRVMGSTTGHVQAAAGGNAITYLSKGSIVREPEGNRSLESSTVLSRRGSAGWATEDITPPNEQVVPLAIGGQSEFKLFTPELTRALLEPRSGTPLSPLASERTPYLWEAGTPPAYTPLATGKEGVANVQPGVEFGGPPSDASGKIGVVGSNQSLTDVVLMAGVPLLAGAPEAPLPALYHWRAGQLQPVSVLPASEGGGISQAQLLGSGAGSVQHAISEDGGRVFWSTGGYGVGGDAISGLYARDTEAQETVRLDAVQGGSGLGAPHPVFQGANPEGTVVLFKDSQQLTAGASPSGSDLYRCEIPAGDISAGCATLSDITPAQGGESAKVIGLASGVSDDADTLYFVAEGALDATPNGLGESAEAGEPNLYRWQEGGGVRFIATLSKEDEPDWGGPAGLAIELSATASPSGRYLAFMSQRSLTGQSNRNAETGDRVQQAFLYDAQADRLQCVSCDPLEAAPSGEVSAGFHQLVDPDRQWVNKWVAAILPQPLYIIGGNSLYQPRTVLDNGRVFFNALSSLVPSDSNGEWDVYQHEPLGVGGCKASSGSGGVVRSGQGCVSLISSGTAEEEAVFLDASESGDDAFFLTTARLSVTDVDEERDLYDARVDGLAATLAPSAECLGEACQPAAVAPSDPTPASAAFKGQGNVKPSARKRCARGQRKVRRGGKARCVARKHKSSKQRGKAKRAGKSGRASR